MKRNKRLRVEPRPPKQKGSYEIDYVSWISSQMRNRDGYFSIASSPSLSRTVLQRLIRMFLCLFLLLSMVACMDYHEVESVTIVSGIGVQMDGEDMVVYLELIEKGRIPSEGEGIRVIQSRGKSFGDAMHNIVLQSGKEPYFGHVQVLIVDEGMLDRLNEVLDDILTQKEIRYDLQVVAAKEAMESLFKQQEQLRAFDLYELLKRNRYYATSMSLRLLDFLDQNQKSYLLPLITMEEEEPVLQEGAILMHRDKKVEEVDASFVRAYLMLEGLFESSLVMVENERNENIPAELRDVGVKYHKLVRDAMIELKGTLLLSEDDQNGYVKNQMEVRIGNDVSEFLLANEEYKLIDLAEKLNQAKWFVNDAEKLPSVLQVNVLLEVENASNVRRGE